MYRGSKLIIHHSVINHITIIQASQPPKSENVHSGNTQHFYISCYRYHLSVFVIDDIKVAVVTNNDVKVNPIYAAVANLKLL